MAVAPGGVEVARVNVRVLPDTSKLFADLERDLKKIESEASLNIRASVDSVELVASTREAVAEAQLAAGDIDVKANVDTSQVGVLEKALGGASDAAGGLFRNFSFLGAGAAALLPAIIPLAAVFVGLAAALAAPIAIAAGGVTIFGFLAGFAVKNTLTQLKTIDTLQKKLAGLQKGTAEYVATQQQLQIAQAGLSPAQKAFAASLDKVKSAFSSLPQGTLLRPLTAALSLLADVIPKLTPIIAAVSGVFSDLIGQLDKLTRSAGFKSFVDAFARQVGPDLKAFASIAGNVFLGLGGLFGAFNDQLSGGVLKSLEDITGKFADFGRDAKNNKGLKAFVDYVKQNMPKIGGIVSGAFSILFDVFKQLAPLGSAVAGALAAILGALTQMKPIVAPLAAALAGLVLPFIGGPEVGLVLGLAVAFKEVYDRSKPLQHLLSDLKDFFTSQLLPIIETAAQQVLPAFKGSIKDISDTIRNNKGFLETFGKIFLVFASATVVTGILAVAGGIRLIGKAFQFGVDAAHAFADLFLVELILLDKAVALFIGSVLNAFSRIVDGAAAAFGWMPKIGPKIRAAQQNFHDFEGSVNGNLQSVGTNLQAFKAQIDAIADSHPSFKVTAQTLEAQRALEALQNFRLKNKTLTVTVEQQLDRVVGPGGGMGRPVGGSGNGAGMGSGNGAGSGALVHVDKVEVRDVNDLLRKTANLHRARAGGGVILAGGGA